MSDAIQAGGDGTCPSCGAARIRVEEDVSDEVTVFACEVCESTWAVRAPEPGRP